MKRLVPIFVLSVLVASAFALARPASAQVVTVEVNPEEQNRTNGTSATLTVQVRDGVAPKANVNVDLEVEAGPNDTDAGLKAPVDMSCTTDNTGTCEVTYNDDNSNNPAAPDNQDRIRAWIDADNSDLSIEADTTEGPNEITNRGNTPEPDSTDVVLVNWVVAAAAAATALDTEADTQIGIRNRETTLTASVIDQYGAPLPNANVDFLVEDGPDQGGMKQCTTETDGKCQVKFTSTETGTDSIRSYVDRNGTNVPEPNEADLQEGRDEVANPGGTPEQDTTDVVSIVWQNEAFVLEVDPEQPSSRINTNVTFHAHVENQIGEPQAGKNVDFFTRDGENQGRREQCDTDAAGDCSITESSTQVGRDEIFAFVDVNTNNFADDASADATEGRDETAEPGEKEEPDGTDIVAAVWTESCPGFETDQRNQVVGDPGDNKLKGTSGDDIICGLDGDDEILGSGGNDIILGGTGRDVLNGEAGDDQLRGGPGGDRMFGRGGKDVLRARDKARDTVDGGTQADRARVDQVDRVAHVETVF